VEKDSWKLKTRERCQANAPATITKARLFDEVQKQKVNKKCKNTSFHKNARAVQGFCAQEQKLNENY
jgi:hypothetical protein